MIIVFYKVSKDLYYATDTVHHTVMITTEYTYKNSKLAYLRMGRNLEIRLNNVLQYEFKKSINPEQFFYCKTYNRKIKPITRDTFEHKLKQFDMPRTVIEQEIVEDYDYTDKKGKPGTVQIAIMVNESGMTATIDFKDAMQCADFVHPAWILPN